MDIQESIKTTSSRIGRSTTFKLITICLLILVLLAPVSMVKSLIREREWRQERVVNEINGKWGQAQTLTGPVISIPFKENVVDEHMRTIQVTNYLHLLPDTLRVKSRVTPQVRYRGIYEAVLYESQLVVEGRFPHPMTDHARILADDVIWEGAFVSLGISDMRGIREAIEGSFGGRELSLEPGVETTDVVSAGVSAPVRLTPGTDGYDFRFVLQLNGSQQLNFVPVGRTTTVNVKSSWPDPSFTGAFLPTKRTISSEKFSADWKVLHMNRNYPQSWVGGSHKLDSSAFGVRLFSPVDVYQKSMRTAKYALMFIVFAFTAFFLSEVIYRQRVHPVQYLLIGLAIVIFYTLLLSFSEHIRFGIAYLVAASAVLGLIGTYAKSILKSSRVTAMVVGILAILYGYLYVLLQLEDYALLMGSLGLFVVLAAVMFATRKIDWYGTQREKTALLGNGPAGRRDL